MPSTFVAYARAARPHAALFARLPCIISNLRRDRYCLHNDGTRFALWFLGGLYIEAYDLETQAAPCAMFAATVLPSMRIAHTTSLQD